MAHGGVPGFPYQSFREPHDPGVPHLLDYGSSNSALLVSGSSFMLRRVAAWAAIVDKKCYLSVFTFTEAEATSDASVVHARGLAARLVLERLLERADRDTIQLREPGLVAQRADEGAEMPVPEPA